MSDDRMEKSSMVLLPWILSILKDMEKIEEDVVHGGEEEVKRDEEKEVKDDAEPEAGESRLRPFDVVLPPLKNVTSVQEVIEAVESARQQKVTLRTAGSEHSAPNAIFPDSPGGITIRLCGELRHVHCFKEAEEDGKPVGYFKIGAGCYLGRNPMDRSSTVENSACYQVNALGFAFPILGGISQQSVGGFMMTGSAGGSLMHGFADVIQEIEFVNGNGELQVATPGTDLWCAVGVSMGLFGVITQVTFRLPRTFLVKGTEGSVMFADSALGPSDDGKTRLEAALRDIEYYHATWFAEKYVGRVMEWKGVHTDMGDIVPYHHTLQNPLTATAAAAVLKITNALQQLKAPTDIDYKIMATLLKMFAPIEKPMEFCDLWYKTLPNDNQAPVDTIIKVDFTEIWFPVDKAQQVMDILEKMFKENPKSAGSFAVEVYSAKASPFWMSMSHGRDVLRVDPYWWHYNEGNIREYYAYYWDALLGVEGARLHWGKWLPEPGQKCGSIVFNEDWMSKAYPKYEDWMKLRAESDPDQLFVSPYWRGVLSIPEKQIV